MDFAETIAALLELEDRLVAMETTITKPASDSDPGHLRDSIGGVLRLTELPRPDGGRPVDEAAWWARCEDHVVLRLEPGVGQLLRRESFTGASRRGECLEIRTRSSVHRLVPLRRADGEEVEVDCARVIDRERAEERKRLRLTLSADA